MTLAGGLAAAFDGDNDQARASCAVGTAVNINGFVGKDYGSGVTKRINGFKVWGSNDQGLIEGQNPSTEVRCYGSNSNPSGPVDGTQLASVTVTDANSVQIEKLSGFVDGNWRYVWATIVHPGGGGTVQMAEAEFYELV